MQPAVSGKSRLILSSQSVSAPPACAGRRSRIALLGLAMLFVAASSRPLSAQVPSQATIAPPPLRTTVVPRTRGLPLRPTEPPQASALPSLRGPSNGATDFSAGVSAVPEPWRTQIRDTANSDRNTLRGASLSPDATPQPLGAQTQPPPDARLPEDRAAFRLPGTPVGFDPQAFAIEVTPRLSERPRQLFRFAPLQPAGIRFGSFVVLPQVTWAAFATSNVLKSETADSDRAVEVLPQLRVVSNWRVHALELRAGGAASRFQNFRSEETRRYDIEARGRIDVRRRTNLEARVARTVSQESRSGVDASPLGSDRANVTDDRALVALNHRFNRLRVQLRGGVRRSDVSDTADADGAQIANDDRDERAREIAVRARWEFKPTLFAFAELALNRRDYGAAPDDGILRDSRGERWRTGLSFGNTDAVLRGQLGLGLGRQRTDDRRLKPIRGLLIDANLAWRISGLTTVLLRAETDLVSTTAAGSPGAQARRFEAALRHAFRRHLIGTGTLSFAQSDYTGIALKETEVSAILDLEYLMNRWTTVLAQYRFTNFTTSQETGDYDEHLFRLGLRLAR